MASGRSDEDQCDRGPRGQGVRGEQGPRLRRPGNGRPAPDAGRPADRVLRPRHSLGDKWNVYGQLCEDLVQRGVREHQVCLAGEAKNDAEKGRLFEACRTGEVAVLIGSTQTMGTGTNGPTSPRVTAASSGKAIRTRRSASRRRSPRDRSTP